MKKSYGKLMSVLSASIITVSSISITASAATGPYRRVNSKSGYTYEEAKIDLPLAGNVYEKGGTNDTAYVYMGGSGNGTEIDAGLQHSPSKGNWAPIISCNGKYSHPFDKERFRGGQTITMQFYVTSNNNVTLKITGITDSGVKKTIVTNAGNASGWNASGAGDILKRVTSIGQKPENLNDGSFLRKVKWHDCLIGTLNNHHKWSANDVKGYINYPNKNKVSVSFINPGEETVNINL